MFSATVAQNPTMAVSDGTKKRKNSPELWNLLGALNTGPQPPACRTIHHSNASPTANMNGAPIPSRNLMASMPLQMTNIFSAQKAPKHIQTSAGLDAAGHNTF